MLKEAKDQRKEYSREIKRLADIVEKGDRQPVGCAMFVFFSTNQSLKTVNLDDGCLPLLVSGTLAHTASEIAKTCVVSEERNL